MPCGPTDRPLGWQAMLSNPADLPRDVNAWLAGAVDCVDYVARLRAACDSLVSDGTCRPSFPRVLATKRRAARVRVRLGTATLDPLLACDVACDPAVAAACGELSEALLLLRRPGGDFVAREGFVAVVAAVLRVLHPGALERDAVAVAERSFTRADRRGHSLPHLCTAALVLMCACCVDTPAPHEMLRLLAAVAERSGVPTAAAVPPHVAALPAPASASDDDESRAAALLAALRRERGARGGASCGGSPPAPPSTAQPQVSSKGARAQEAREEFPGDQRLSDGGRGARLTALPRPHTAPPGPVPSPRHNAAPFRVSSACAAGGRRGRGVVRKTAHGGVAAAAGAVAAWGDEPVRLRHPLPAWCCLPDKRVAFLRRPRHRRSSEATDASQKYVVRCTRPALSQAMCCR